MKKQTKLFTTLSAAALLTIGVSAVSMAAGWDNSTGEWRYLNADGTEVTDTWKYSNGNWFYLNSDGVMATNQLIEDNNNSKTRYFYVDQYGAMVTNSWKAVAMDDADGGDLEAEYYWYYFGSDGKAYTNDSGKVNASHIKTIGNNKYTFDENGRMLYGWIDKDNVAQQDGDDYAWKNSDYYFNGWNDGHMQTGWAQITVKNDEVKDDEDETQTYWFNFQGSGKKRKGRKKVNGSYYHFHSAYGYMLTDWGEASDSVTTSTSPSEIYYLNGDGSERKNKWVWAVPDQDYIEDDYNDDEYRWFYFGKNGKLTLNQIKKINGKSYAFDDLGRMKVGFVTKDTAGDIHGLKKSSDWSRSEILSSYNVDNDLTIASTDTLYFFSNDEEKDGAMKKGYQTLELSDQDAQFYFNTSNGKAENNYVSKIKKYTVNGLILQPTNDDDSNYAGVVVSGNSGDALKYVVPNDDGKRLIFGEEIKTTMDDGDTVVLVNKAGTKATSKGKLKDSNDAYYIVNGDGVVLKYFASEEDYNDFVGYKQGTSDTEKKLSINSSWIGKGKTFADLRTSMINKFRELKAHDTYFGDFDTDEEEE